jgi:hypothetical protein
MSGSLRSHSALAACLTAVLLSISGCQGRAAPERPELPGLIGTWEWVGTSGGIAGDSRTPRPDDPRITVRFDPAGKALFHSDGEVAREQRYRVSSEITIFGPGELPVLYFDDEELGRVVGIDGNGAALTLSDNVYDGFSLQYRRVDE